MTTIKIGDKTIKRYWVFCGSKYYPFGGMEDFKDSFSTIDEIRQVVKPCHSGGCFINGSHCEWIQVWDMLLHEEVGEIVV